MEQIAEFERVALVVWAAAVAAAVEGFVVVVDRTAALAVAAVAPVHQAEVVVVVAEWLLAVAASEQSLAIAALDWCPAVAAVDQIPAAAAVAEYHLAVAAVWWAVLAQVAAQLVDLGPNRQSSNPPNQSLQNRHYRSCHHLNHY